MISLVLVASLLGQVDGGEEVVSTWTNPLPELQWSPRGEVFGEYGVQKVEGIGVFNAFNVPRVQLGLEAEWRGVRGRLLVEGARSTEGGALIGTAGDSVIVRLREGWAGYRWRFLEARLGMIAMPVIAELERAFAFRALTADGLEVHRLYAPADLGATLRASFDFGWLALTAANGEGYTFRELDAGKNVELTAVGKPLAFLSRPQLELMVSGRVGSTGIAGNRSDRLGGGVLWAGEKLGAGVTAFYARGLRDDSGLRALLLQAFVRGKLFDHLLLAVRVHRLQRDLDASGDDSLTELLASAGARIVGPLDVFLCFQKTWASPLARAAQPGIDAWGGRLVVRLRYPESSPLD